jgi:DNA-binding IclR family transcriptional regulator
MQAPRETSLGKALKLLFLIAESEDPAGVSVSELVRLTGLSRPTTYRFLGELQEFGLVTAVPKRPMWQLGPKVIALAAMAGNWGILRRRAKQAMEEFVRSVGYTVHFGILDGREVVYIDKSESTKHLTISSVVGQRRALHVTALGKCLVAFDPNPEFAAQIAKEGLPPRTFHSITDSAAWLAEIEKVRATGVAFDNEECDLGARCVAAPIRDSQGYVVAAISLSALTSRADELDFRRLADEIRGLANRISLNGPAAESAS